MTAPLLGPLPLLREGGAAGAVNMRRDLELLRACAGGEIAGALRLYWFAPACLSLGRLQPLEDVDTAACARDGVDVVRRPSGGRAVLHEHEVTYALVCRVRDARFGGDVLASCARIHAVVAAGLARLGVEALPRAVPRDLRAEARAAATSGDCFAHPAAHELVDTEGRKLVGSAQVRLGPALLQHGSVLLEAPRARRYLLRGGSAAAAAGLRDLAGRALTREDVAEALALAFGA